MTVVELPSGYLLLYTRTMFYIFNVWAVYDFSFDKFCNFFNWNWERYSWIAYIASALNSPAACLRKSGFFAPPLATSISSIASMILLTMKIQGIFFSALIIAYHRRGNFRKDARSDWEISKAVRHFLRVSPALSDNVISPAIFSASLCLRSS